MKTWKTFRGAILFLVAVLCVLGSTQAPAFADELSPVLQDKSGELMTLGEFRKALRNGDCVVVDVRSSDEFNGWSLNGLQQGGHIRGSVNFDAGWIAVETKDKDQKLNSVLVEKGITPAKKIVLCSAQRTERQRVKALLKKKGFSRVCEFDLTSWIDAGEQLVRFPEFHRLLPATIVKQLLEGKKPQTFESVKRLKFVEVSWGDESASYLKGHVPGCFHVNTDHFEPPPSWYLGDAKVLTGFARRYGFQTDDTVIITGEDVTASFRLAIVLEYMGVADVRVLNGGLASWKGAGFAVETKRNDPPPSQEFGKKIPECDKLILKTSAVKTALDINKDFALVDTRTWDEFVGKSSGYSYHKHKGRIPKAIYGQCNFKGANSMEPYRNIDGTMRDPQEIVKMWKEAGIDVSGELCFYCGGGWRAAEVWTSARVFGLKSATLYSDGWIGWSNDESNAVVRGTPK